MVTARFGLAVLFMGISLSGQAAVVSTQISATVNPNGFNIGPFAAGDAISMGFQWDTAAVRDWGLSYLSVFETGVKNVVLDVAGYVVTGTDAYVTQRDNGNDDQIEIRLGNYLGNDYGTLVSAPDINGYAFESVVAVFRSDNQLFPTGDTTTLISSPADMYLDSLTIRFDDADANTFYDDVLNPHNKSFEMTSLSVPLPSGLALMMAGFMVFGRRVQQRV